MIKEEENEKIFTIIKILILIIEGIIIGAIAFIFFGVSKVNAQAVNPNSNEIYAEALNGDNPEYINIGQNQEYSLSILKRSNLFVSNFINLGTGVYKGTAYVKYYNTQGETCSQLRQATNRVTLSLNNVAVNGTINIPACTISDNYATLKIEYSYTNMQTNGVFKLIYRLPFWNIGTKFLMNSTLDYEEKDYATNTDIENQTISIINNAIQNATDIISTNILSKEAIILAMNAATAQIQNAISNQNNYCQIYNYENEPVEINNNFLNTNGSLIENSNWNVSEYIKINKNYTYKLSYTSNPGVASYCIYNNDKVKILCQTLPNNTEISIKPTIDGYIRYSIIISSINKVIFKGNNCEDRTEAEIDAIDNMNITISTKLQEAFDMEEENAEEQKGLLQSIISGIGGLFNILSDDDIDDPENSLNGLNNSLISDTPISSLLLLPVSIYQKVVNNINGTCSPINLGQLFNHDLIMTCIHIDDIIGSTLYSVIDVIISGFFILSIRKKVIEIFNNLTSLKTRRNELE